MKTLAAIVSLPTLLLPDSVLLPDHNWADRVAAQATMELRMAVDTPSRFEPSAVTKQRLEIEAYWPKSIKE